MAAAHVTPSVYVNTEDIDMAINPIISELSSMRSVLSRVSHLNLWSPEHLKEGATDLTLRASAGGQGRETGTGGGQGHEIGRGNERDERKIEKDGKKDFLH